MSAYTREMRAAVHTVKIPVEGFKMDVIEFEEMNPPWLALRFYWSQWETFTDTERIKLLEYLGKVQKILEAHVISVMLDPVIDKPNAQIK